MLDIEIKSANKKKILETVWTRDLSKVSASDFEAILNDYDWSPIYMMSDPDEATEFLVKNVYSALDKVAPQKLIKFRYDKPPLYLNRDTLRIMKLRDTARTLKNPQYFRALRNKANKLIKRDKVLSIVKRLRKSPGPKQMWQVAKTILGKGQRSNKLPDVTTNSNPNDTADTQNDFFVEKIAKLVNNHEVHEGTNPFKCESCDQNCAHLCHRGQYLDLYSF